MDWFEFNRYPDIGGLIDRIKAVSEQYKLSIQHELVNDGQGLDEWVHGVTLEVPNVQPIRVILTGNVSEAIESAVDQLEVIVSNECYKVVRYHALGEDEEFYEDDDEGDYEDDDYGDDDEGDYEDDDYRYVIGNDESPLNEPVAPEPATELPFCCTVARITKPELEKCPICGANLK